MTIIVSKNGSNAKIVKPTGFDEERSLQEYIHENPESIPIHELRDDKKLLILKREFPTNSGPILKQNFIKTLTKEQLLPRLWIMGQHYGLIR
jgi:hypothetical protein